MILGLQSDTGLIAMPEQMTPTQTLSCMFDLAIEAFKESHSDEIPEVEPEDYDDLTALVIALRDRARAIARPIILRTARTVIQSTQLQDQELRVEAVRYIGQHWEYFLDTQAVVDVLVQALFETESSIQIAAATSLGRMGAEASRSIEPLEVLQRRTSDDAVRRAIDMALASIRQS